MNKKLIYAVIIVTSITSFFSAYISSAISIVLPTMGEFFKMNNVVQNWISLIYLLFMATFTIAAGVFSKKYGLKKSLLIGVLIFLIGAVISGFANSSAVILSSRAIEGFGVSFIYVAGVAMIVKAVDESIRGTALGINLGAFYVGLTLAPFLAGFLSSNYGWQSIFLIEVPFLILVIFLIFAFIKTDWIYDKNLNINYKSLILISMAIFLIMYGFSILNQILGIVLIIIGLLLAVISFKSKNPVFDIKLFKNVKFAASTIASLTSYIGIYVLTFILNYHFQYIMGYSVEFSGILLVIGPLLMTFSTVIAGRLADKRNPEAIAICGISIVLISLIMTSLINKNSSLNYLVLLMVLYGVGYGLFASPNTKVIMSALPIKYNASASVAVAASKYLGKTISLSLFTVIFSIIMGNVVINKANYTLLILSSQITGVICTIFCFIALIASVVCYRNMD